MGGIDSRRIYQSSEVKKVIENQISINILDLNKKGFLEPDVISFFFSEFEHQRVDYYHRSRRVALP